MSDLLEWAIIGGGIGGLTALYSLQNKYPFGACQLFEKEPVLGGNIRTVYDVESGRLLYESGPWRLKTDHYHFRSLLEHLQIPTKDLPHRAFRLTMDSYHLRDFSTSSVASSSEKSLYIPDGMSTVIRRLEQKIEPSLIHKTSPVHDIILTDTDAWEIHVQDETIAGSYTIRAKRILICVPCHVWSAWTAFRSTTATATISRYFKPKDYLKIMVESPVRPRFRGEDYFYVGVPSLIEKVISASDKDAGWFCVSYSEDLIARKWMDLFERDRKEFDRRIRSHLIFLFPNQDIECRRIVLEYHPRASYVIPKVFQGYWPVAWLEKPLRRCFILADTFSVMNDCHIEGVLERLYKFGLYHLTDAYPISHWCDISIEYTPLVDFIINQMTYNCCTANACANLIYILMKRIRYPVYLPSSLYIYYNTRHVLGTTNEDSGSTMQALVEALDTYGICPEALWPFQTQSVYDRPSQACYDFARKNPMEISVVKIPDSVCRDYHAWHRHVREKLLSGWIFLVNIYRSNPRFQTTDKCTSQGILRPIDGETAYYHSIILLGIRSRTEQWVCLNSHGLREGDTGLVYINFHQTFDILDPATSYSFKIRSVPTTFLWSDDDYNNYNNDNASSLALTDPSNRSGMSLSYIPYTIKNHPTWRRYDHIIVGAGLTGAYLAYSLRRLHPQDSILVLDYQYLEGTFEDVILDETTTGNASVYQFSTRWFKKMAEFIRRICPEEQWPLENKYFHNPVYPWTEKVLRALDDLFGMALEDRMSRKGRYQIYKTARFQRMTPDEFLREFVGLDEDTIDLVFTQSLKTHRGFYDNISMALFHPILTHCLTSDSDWRRFPITMKQLISYLLEGFSLVSFQNLISSPGRSPLCMIPYVACHSVDNETNVCQIGLTRSLDDPTSCGDTIGIQFGNLYYATSHVVPNMDKCILQKRLRANAFVFCKRSLSNWDKTFYPDIGRVFPISSDILECNITNETTYTRLYGTRHAHNITNGVIYNLGIWPEIKRIVDQNFGDFEPYAFCLFMFKQSYHFTGMPVDGTGQTLWDLIHKQWSPATPVHHLNSCFSPYIYCCEGSFDMVDEFLECMHDIVL